MSLPFDRSGVLCISSTVASLVSAWYCYFIVEFAIVISIAWKECCAISAAFWGLSCGGAGQQLLVHSGNE